MVDDALPLLIKMMNDPVVQVKDTTAWTLGRISELLSTSIKPDQLQSLAGAVVAGLNDQPRVAANCAWVSTFFNTYFPHELIFFINSA